jgi:outer membrane protein insertion porin family/translocation and assembly module TamA
VGSGVGKAWGLVAIAILVTGCAAKQEITCSPADLQGCVVDRVEIEGNEALDDGDIEAKIATAETGGLLEGVPLLGAIDALSLQYERFDRFVLERDLQRIQRLYRAKGYYDARVRAGRVRRIDDRKSKDNRDVRVLVEIVVEEGQPVRVRTAVPRFSDWDAAKVQGSDAGRAVTNALLPLKSEPIFTEEQYEAVRKAIQRSLTDLGYAYARVEASAEVDLQRRTADVSYTIEVGPKCTMGEVTLVGLGEVPAWQVRPSLGFEEGDDYSTRSLEEAEIALSDFGVFGSIAIEPQLSNPKRPTKVPIKITAQPGALRSVRLGGGFELGGMVATRGIAGWQNKNMFGALDRFNVEGRPRLVIYPWKLSNFTSDPQLVPEIAARLQYSLPIPRDPRTVTYVQGQGSVALETNLDVPDELKEGDNIPGEYLAEQRLGIERRFVYSRLLVGLAHNLLYSQPFSYNDAPFEDQSLLISYLQHYVEVDLRRGETGKWDALHPRSGFFGAVTADFAGYFIGGDADDLRIRPEVRFYLPLVKRVTIAGRFSMGFLHAKNYDRILTEDFAPAQVAPEGGDAELRSELARNVQILNKRGLFSGGPTSNRGYGFNEIAPHRTVGDDGTLLLDPDAIGGSTLWEASVEMRIWFVGELGGTLFVDAGDVTRRLGELRIDHPHVSSGIGLRYDTAVGPLRLDLGFRIPYLQVAGEAVVESCIKLAEPCATVVIDEGDPTSFLGMPAALSIAIGNVY